MKEIIQFKLERVGLEDKDILFRLLQYSLFEESITDLNEMNNDAIFEYKWFDNYFQDDNREAYFIKEKQSNKILGFAMVNKYMQKKQFKNIKTPTGNPIILRTPDGGETQIC